MNFEFPLVFFTVLTQLAAGLAIFICLDMLSEPGQEDARLRCGWLAVFICSALGLIASLFHLGHPFQAYKALYNLGDSWLSREGLGFACFCLLALITYLRPTRFLALFTALVGAFSLVAQGLTYGQPSMPAINNALPMALFWLSAIAMGACGQSLLKPQKSPVAVRLWVLALCIALLAGPAIWISGSATMEQSTLLWLSSPAFWIGLLLIAATFAATWLAAQRGRWQLAALICGILLTRMTFFADTVHTAKDIGLPFN